MTKRGRKPFKGGQQEPAKKVLEVDGSEAKLEKGSKCAIRKKKEAKVSKDVVISDSAFVRFACETYK